LPVQTQLEGSLIGSTPLLIVKRKPLLLGA
jgi:hypothetical protein